MITLTAEEHKQIDDLIHRGMNKARVLTRARILLKSADGWSIVRIAQALDVCPAMVSNTRHRYQQGGVPRVLGDLPPKPHEPALEAERNAANATITWRFRTEEARRKMQRIYPL